MLRNYFRHPATIPFLGSWPGLPHVLLSADIPFRAWKSETARSSTNQTLIAQGKSDALSKSANIAHATLLPTAASNAGTRILAGMYENALLTWKVNQPGKTKESSEETASKSEFGAVRFEAPCSSFTR